MMLWASVGNYCRSLGKFFQWGWMSIAWLSIVLGCPGLRLFKILVFSRIVLSLNFHMLFFLDFHFLRFFVMFAGFSSEEFLGTTLLPKGWRPAHPGRE